MSAARSAKSIFILAADLPPEARRAVLDEHCAGRPELRAEVESLLAHDPGGGVLADGAFADFSVRGEPLPLRGTVGPYTIQRLIAEGGSAAVYQALQSSPQRRVALKVLRRGESGDLWRRRFEREAEVLARLDHPGIAHFYAFGVTPESRPYIAMELVEGETITAFAARHALTLRQRIELVIQACEAAEYGHRRGVVHRDLKPGNILVSLEEGRDAGAARVRLVDFGVARITQPGSDLLPMTATGVLIGTPAYMSPEQIAGGPEAVDARADVYALGVVLYELACGKAPFGGEHTAPIELLHRILEQQPTRLGLLDPALGGDFEVIVAKALARDAPVRYQTASELADDLRRFIQRRPILARPPSLAYLARSFVRRNRLLTAALAAALVATLASTALMVRESVLSRRAEALAVQDAESWREMTELLWRIPGSRDLRASVLAQVIPEMERRALARPNDVPSMLMLAGAYTAKSDVVLEMGRTSDARLWREAALELLRSCAGARPQSVQVQRELARAMVLLGDVDDRTGATASMFGNYRAALDIHERLAADYPFDPHIASELFWSYQRLSDQYHRCGDVETAQTLLTRQQAVARLNHDRWPDSPQAIFALASTLRMRPVIDDVAENPLARMEEALTLASRLAAAQPPAKHHAGLYVVLASSVAARWLEQGHQAQAISLLDECAAVVLAFPPTPGEEPLLDEARLDFLNVSASLALARGDTSAARAHLESALPFARHLSRMASPGDNGRGSLETGILQRIRDLEDAGN